jgi:hypothetical protein
MAISGVGIPASIAYALGRDRLIWKSLEYGLARDRVIAFC